LPPPSKPAPSKPAPSRADRSKPRSASPALPAAQAGDLRDPSSDDLLAWYDRHRRALPWRALPGETPDPYRVWLSEIMLQQTTVRAVKPYFERFLGLFPTVVSLAQAPAEEVMRAWAGLG
jgi:A/G-specific adenine glycosylase